MRAQCKFDGCLKPVHGQGYCHTHYCRIRNTGDVTKGRVYEKKPAPIRFWAKVSVAGADECWEWQGGKKEGGHGVFFDGERLVPAHRFSYELHHGPIVSGLEICHTCDNPPCVNPTHLFAGTHKDNMEDCVQKGRSRRGTLTISEIQAIRLRKECGASATLIASEFSVSRRTISRAVRDEIRPKK